MVNIKELVFSYPKSDFEISIPFLTVKEGESLAITGPSGSGKTTLLNLISGILQSQSGEIHIDKNSISKMKEDECRAYRISQIGMLFQGFELQMAYRNPQNNSFGEGKLPLPSGTTFSTR